MSPVGGTPISQRLEVPIPAQPTPATVQSFMAGEAQVTGEVVSVTLAPETTITGVATNNRKFAVVNKGQTGVGTVEIAAITFASGTNAPADSETALTLSATPANRLVVPGDILQVEETVNGTGMASPGGRVQVEIARTA